MSSWAQENRAAWRQWLTQLDISAVQRMKYTSSSQLPWKLFHALNLNFFQYITLCAGYPPVLVIILLSVSVINQVLDVCVCMANFVYSTHTNTHHFVEESALTPIYLFMAKPWKAINEDAQLSPCSIIHLLRLFGPISNGCAKSAMSRS